MRQWCFPGIKISRKWERRDRLHYKTVVPGRIADFYWYLQTYQKGKKIYQMATKCTKYRKIDKFTRTIKISSFARPSKIYPNRDFNFQNIPSGNPGHILPPYIRLLQSITYIYICVLLPVNFYGRLLKKALFRNFRSTAYIQLALLRKMQKNVSITEWPSLGQAAPRYTHMFFCFVPNKQHFSSFEPFNKIFLRHAWCTHTQSCPSSNSHHVHM
jgi:hypothetical protein